MKVGRKKIAAVIADRMKSGDSSKALSEEIAAYLMQSGRSSELSSIMRDVIAIRAEDGNVEAAVISAHSLSPSSEKEVKDLAKVLRPNAKKIVLDENLDPSLIGGFKLNVVSRSVDLTVRAKLNRLKQLANQGGV